MQPGKQIIEQTEVRKLYGKRAKHYDLSANLYYLIGFREYTYRRQAVELLDLHLGDTVVELGCGAGLNFSYIQQKVGPQGRVIDVELTEEMLKMASISCHDNGWGNVELIQHDVSSFIFPQRVDVVISTFSLTLVPEYQVVILNAEASLNPGKCMVLLDLKLPDWTKPFIKLGILLTSGFGVNEDIAKRHPWEDMKRQFGNLTMMNIYFGAVYLAMSERSTNRNPE